MLHSAIQSKVSLPLLYSLIKQKYFKKVQASEAWERNSVRYHLHDKRQHFQTVVLTFLQLLYLLAGHTKRFFSSELVTSLANPLSLRGPWSYAHKTANALWTLFFVKTVRFDAIVTAIKTKVGWNERVILKGCWNIGTLEIPFHIKIRCAVVQQWIPELKKETNFERSSKQTLPSHLKWRSTEANTMNPYKAVYFMSGKKSWVLAILSCLVIFIFFILLFFLIPWEDRHITGQYCRRK